MFLNKIKFTFLFLFSHLLLFGQGGGPTIPKEIQIEELPIKGITFDIYQDKRGFLWFCTDYGLVRFNGDEFIYFNHDPDNPNSLSGNAVNKVVEDGNGNLWISVIDKGIHKMNLKTREITRFIHVNGDTNSISSNNVKTLFIDNDENLWIGTVDGGLDRLSIRTGRFYHYNKSGANQVGANSNSIFDIKQSLNGNICIAGEKAISLYNPVNDSFQHFSIPFNEKIEQQISVIEPTKDGLLLGTLGGKLFLFDEEREIFQRWNLYSKNNSIDPDKSFRSILKDNDGIYWIGGKGGLIRLTSFKQNGKDLNVNYSNVFSSEWIFPVFQSLDGLIWVGTDDNIKKVHTKTKKLNHFPFKNIKNGFETVGNVSSIVPNDDQTVWVGSFGINLYDKKTNTLDRDFFKNLGIDTFTNLSTVTLFKGSRNHLWISTLTNFDGNFRVFDFDVENKSVREFTHELIQFSEGVTATIGEDKINNIWFGTDDGLIKYNPEMDSYKLYQNQLKDTFSLPQNKVRKVFKDRKGNLWIGFNNNGVAKYDSKKDGFITIFRNTENSASFGNIFDIADDPNGNIWICSEGGLHCYNPELNQTTTYTKKNGLPSNSIKSALADKKGNIWFATNNGFGRLNPLKGSIHVFNKLEGIQHTDYWYRSKGISPDGYFYFGGIYGFNYFHPDSVIKEGSFPSVFITEFSLFNQKVVPGDSARILKEEISHTSSIELDYLQNVFTIKFSALEFQFPEKIKFQYQMEGFDTRWLFTDSQTEATYTNLDPGDYLFKVKSTNSNGEWNEEFASLNIKVLPPPWKTTWAYLSYFVIAVGLVLFFRQQVIYRERLKNNLKLEKIEKEKITELDQLKTQFFANISHEFRTPLTLIQGPAKNLIDKERSESAKKNGVIIFRNANRLLKLINQLLLFTKVEGNSMELKLVSVEFISFLKVIFSNFESLAEVRKISYIFHTDSESFHVMIDKDKMERVLVNLLSNAFKFTPDGGNINLVVKTNKKDNHFEFFVQDTGIGIPKRKLPLIFNRFYQVDNKNTRKYEGTGIGLFLVKKFIELHNGKISVESKKKKGSRFKVVIPLVETKGISIENKDSEMDLTPFAEKYFQENSIESKTVIDLYLKVDSNKKYKILVIDDNQDMRAYIIENLESEFSILEASDGVEGLKMILKEHPDLIISDIMMPGLDGQELCKKVKEDEQISHIPIVLLTARVGEEEKLEGLKNGADDYITKPFSPLELKVRIKNLIEQRQKLRELYQHSMLLEPDKITVTSTDERFLKKALEIMEKNKSNAAFNTEEFAHEMGMSRTAVYRKLKALTGQSANEFIQSFRLKYAARLLEQEYGNIAQISFEAGFNHQSYFTSCFKKQFGVKPKEYQQRERAAKMK